MSTLFAESIRAPIVPSVIRETSSFSKAGNSVENAAAMRPMSTVAYGRKYETTALVRTRARSFSACARRCGFSSSSGLSRSRALRHSAYFASWKVCTASLKLGTSSSSVRKACASITRVRSSARSSEAKAHSPPQSATSRGSSSSGKHRSVVHSESLRAANLYLPTSRCASPAQACSRESARGSSASVVCSALVTYVSTCV
mmetsp:Transcript_40220/g.99406  ORF Transcript_40220/g.99406 Transcript_40220/m.99406 type:complete len:201 (-) Transcript_40220:535-1137(-)